MKRWHYLDLMLRFATCLSKSLINDEIYSSYFLLNLEISFIIFRVRRSSQETTRAARAIAERKGIVAQKRFRDSFCESSVIAGRYDQLGFYEMQGISLVV